jgi:hypothetical protein
VTEVTLKSLIRIPDRETTKGKADHTKLDRRHQENKGVRPEEMEAANACPEVVEKHVSVELR